MNPRWRKFDPFAWIILGLLAALAVYGGVGTYANGRADAARQEASIKQNADNAVTNCENANESRQANRAMWSFVLDLLSASNPDVTPAEAAFLFSFRNYVNDVYRPHDCAQLDLKYPQPKPPSIPDSS